MTPWGKISVVRNSNGRFKSKFHLDLIQILFKVKADMKKFIKTVVSYIKELSRPLTPEEKKQAGIISAHAYRMDLHLKEMGE